MRRQIELSDATARELAGSGDYTGVPGSGLGLAIVRGLAEANGAVVRIEPRPGGGSVFTVSLPTSSAASATTRWCACGRWSSTTSSRSGARSS